MKFHAGFQFALTTGFLVLLSGMFCPGQDLHWYKGNTHTHTLNSDGDSTPDEVVTWYREHGYQFLILSDHNYLTRVEALNALHGADEKFLVIPGEEVSDRFGDSPLHVNGLNLNEFIPPQGGNSIVEALQNDISAIRHAEGVPHINHPNFYWAISAEHLEAVGGYRLLEIYNAHPLVNNLGGGGTPGMEEVWDRLLSGGKVIFGIAVDDAHFFKRPWDPDAAPPGKAWVTVRAPRLTAEALMEAMEAGDFYASTGVELKDLRISPESFEFDIQVFAQSRYRTQFIGEGGKILQESWGESAGYRFAGDEFYVRAKIVDSNGRQAWLQPVFPRKFGPLAPASAQAAVSAAAPPVQIPNAKLFSPTVLVGGQPSAENLSEAAAAGFRQVINLRTPGETLDWNEAEVAASVGLNYVSIPVAGAAGLTLENARLLAEALARSESGGVVLHCGSGNRVGALLALKAFFLDGIPASRAIQLGLDNGLRSLEGAVREILKQPPN